MLLLYQWMKVMIKVKKWPYVYVFGNCNRLRRRVTIPFIPEAWYDHLKAFENLQCFHKFILKIFTASKVLWSDLQKLSFWCSESNFSLKSSKKVKKWPSAYVFGDWNRLRRRMSIPFAPEAWYGHTKAFENIQCFENYIWKNFTASRVHWSDSKSSFFWCSKSNFCLKLSMKVKKWPFAHVLGDWNRLRRRMSTPFAPGAWYDHLKAFENIQCFHNFIWKNFTASRVRWSDLQKLSFWYF